MCYRTKSSYIICVDLRLDVFAYNMLSAYVNVPT